jgi:hypothetical protein
MAHPTTVALAAGLLLTALPIEVRGQEERFHVSVGGGFTTPNSEVRDQLGNGYNFAFGVQFDLTPAIGLEGFLSTNNLGDQRLSLSVSPTPGAFSIPTDVSVHMTMELATANLVVQRPDGRTRPYGLMGVGVYGRPVRVTTTGIGWVPAQCDPWWYVCYSGGFVPVETIVGERNSTDFGLAFGGGVNLGASFFAEARYHYIWGPTIEVTQVNPLAAPPAPQKANGQFLATTLGVRF